eukprot:COSAG01_NODE_41356_length_452_cov_1.674221_1_plen_45_part_10
MCARVSITCGWLQRKRLEFCIGVPVVLIALGLVSGVITVEGGAGT